MSPSGPLLPQVAKSRHCAQGAALLAAVTILAGPGHAQVCRPEPNERLIESTSLRLVWRAEPQPIPVGRHFTLRLRVCDLQDQAFTGSLAVDAQMPAHRHGMNYRPSVAGDGRGGFTAEGLLFHMPGQWQLLFDLESGGRRERLSVELAVD